MTNSLGILSCLLLFFPCATRYRLKELYQETASGNPDSEICRSPSRAVPDCIETLLPAASVDHSCASAHWRCDPFPSKQRLRCNSVVWRVGGY